MGVYIKGMEMPAKQALAVINPDGLMEILNSDNILVEEFYAVSVPTHGRLIDADALMGRIEYDAPLSSTFEKVMRWYIENAPTIIPAEEGET